MGKHGKSLSIPIYWKELEKISSASFPKIDPKFDGS
jgi:hypothetical protein